MGRYRRRFPGDDIFHVSNGVAAGRLFLATDHDYARLLDLFDRARAFNPIRVLGYGLMPTHWQAVVWPWCVGDVSAFVRSVTLMHTRWWHERRGTRGTGPLYRGRFRSFPVQPDGHLLAVLRFVEAEPRRAGLVERAEDWPWSSLADRLRTGPATGRLRDGPVPLPADWAGYVNQSSPEAELKAVRQSTARGCPFGSANWQRQTAERLGLKFSLRPRGRPRKGAN